MAIEAKEEKGSTAMDYVQYIALFIILIVLSLQLGLTMRDWNKTDRPKGVKIRIFVTGVFGILLVSHF